MGNELLTGWWEDCFASCLTQVSMVLAVVTENLSAPQPRKPGTSGDFGERLRLAIRNEDASHAPTDTVRCLPGLPGMSRIRGTGPPAVILATNPRWPVTAVIAGLSHVARSEKWPLLLEPAASRHFT